MRWTASMVADVHRILARGGVFHYPADARHSATGGKLPLLHEANPMAMLLEQAGGSATTGKEHILNVVPKALHQRIGVILGSANEVARVRAYHSLADVQRPSEC